MADKQKNDAVKNESDNSKENTDGASQTRIRWDGSKMTSTYANVCNVTSTREEVTLLFGTNQSFNPAQGELTVELSNRVILNPYAAKRLAQALSNVMKEYESRFGALKTEPADIGKSN